MKITNDVAALNSAPPEQTDASQKTTNSDLPLYPPADQSVTLSTTTTVSDGAVANLQSPKGQVSGTSPREMGSDIGGEVVQ